AARRCAQPPLPCAIRAHGGDQRQVHHGRGLGRRRAAAVRVDRRAERLRARQLTVAPALMLNVFVAAPEGLRRVALDEDGSIPADALWIDLLEPTEHEERAVEALLGLDVPTREEMREIEASNRLYED